MNEADGSILRRSLFKIHGTLKIVMQSAKLPSSQSFFIELISKSSVITGIQSDNIKACGFLKKKKKKIIENFLRMFLELHLETILQTS